MSSSVDPVTGPTPEPAANRYTPDAHERIMRIRAMANEFSDSADPRSLTAAEIRIARGTLPAALEKAAVFAEAAPGVGTSASDVVELRDAIAYELAYAGVRDEARHMARRIDEAILRRKVRAVKITRGLYRVGKGYVTMDAGVSLKPHVTDMRNTLIRRRKKNAPPVENPDAGKEDKK